MSRRRAGAGKEPLRRVLYCAVPAWFLAAAMFFWQRPSLARTGSPVPADSMEVVLTVPAAARAGEPVRIRVEVRNRGDRTVDLYLRGREPTLDVVVIHAESGELVWRRLERQVVPAIVHLRPLQPADSIVLETTWNQRTNMGVPVGPGPYTVRGLVLLETGRLESPPRTVSITVH